MEQTKFSFKDTLKENLALAVYNTGYEVCDGGHKWGPALRDHYLLHYIRSGKGEYTFDGRVFHLGAGDMFLVFPSTLVSYKADTKEPWEYCWVGFNGTEARRMLKETGFSKSQPVLHPEKADKLQEFLFSIYRSSGNTPAADADMAGYLYLFLGELMRLAHEKRRQPEVQDYLSQALRYIQYNYAANIQVSQIASYVGISRSQLYRAFMEKLELSPHNFLKRYRVNEACSLLRNAALSISEVANSVGFSDPLYFSRVFKELKGMPPTEFQQLNRSK
jgi:AraC-like DNA-binding protein